MCRCSLCMFTIQFMSRCIQALKNSDSTHLCCGCHQQRSPQEPAPQELAVPENGTYHYTQRCVECLYMRTSARRNIIYMLRSFFGSSFWSSGFAFPYPRFRWNPLCRRLLLLPSALLQDCHSGRQLLPSAFVAGVPDWPAASAVCIVQECQSQQASTTR